MRWDIPSQQDLLCVADMAQWTSSITSGSYWALKMIDSWGSLPSGYLVGNVVDLGNYDECVGIRKVISSSHRIKGKYCFLELPIAQWFGVDNEILKYTNMKIATCFPASCSAKTMDKFLGQMLKRYVNWETTGLGSIDESSCRTNESKALDGLTISIIVLLSVFGVLMVLATLTDYFIFTDKNIPSLVIVFSARFNSRTLFRIVDRSNSSPNVINCLEGIRCLSLIWVVYGHEYVFAVKKPNLNQSQLFWWFEYAYSSFILQGTFTVDTFFFLSGLLVVLVTLRSMEKNKGKLNIPKMYLYRYIRLTPVLALAILMYMKILPLLGNGPISSFFNYNVCERIWYRTLTYTQNYGVTEICLPHTWYLAVDMQLYLLSPLFLIALFKWGRKAAGGICVLMLMLSACLFATMMIGKYSLQFNLNMNIMLAAEAMKKLYLATHTHAAPWLIGFLFGYFLHSSRGKSFHLSRFIIWIAWILSLGMIFTSLFSKYASAQWRAPAMSTLEESLYYTLTRVAWPLALCWIVFACLQGYGGMANSFLSSPLWQPLSRLSYSAYIWHIFLLEVHHMQLRSHTYFSDYQMMLNFWSDFGFTLLMSYVVYIVIEAPLVSGLTLLLPNRRSSLKTQQNVNGPPSGLNMSREASATERHNPPSKELPP
ncbi:nose resistant to fluoxetine protein 6-like [Drosophila tropicalis]|uniref:nose resistant to fluoxetine protein 6-like n=1 Tax=Drosophila tropicalis TaxID=46794 RepID=UPI0035ABB582